MASVYVWSRRQKPWKLKGAEAERERTEGAIEPRLVAHAIREPAVGATNSNVHDEIEWLVERCSVEVVAGTCCIRPRVGCHDSLGAVGDERREVATIEEGLVEAQIQESV